MGGNKYRFHFTAALLDLPFFDLASERGLRANETVLYHMVNLSWYFRRRVVDKLYNRLLEVISMNQPDLATLRELYDSIGSELMQISAQAVIRGLDNLLVFERALDPDDQEGRELLERLKKGRSLRDLVFRRM